MKEAYMSACKWYASTVLSKNELNHVSVEFIKNPPDINQSPSVTVKLYAYQESSKVKTMHCEACKEVHKIFYMNDVNCNTCNIKSYQKRIIEALQIKTDLYLEKLDNSRRDKK